MPRVRIDSATFTSQMRKYSSPLPLNSNGSSCRELGSGTVVEASAGSMAQAGSSDRSDLDGEHRPRAPGG
jgi:hypothetical protein